MHFEQRADGFWVLADQTAGNKHPMMNLKPYLESRQGDELHLRLTNSAEIEGRLVVVGEDIVGLESAQGTTMILRCSAGLATRYVG